MAADRLIATRPMEASELTGADNGDLPAWVGTLAGSIWIDPDIDAVGSEIAREMEEGVASS